MSYVIKIPVQLPDGTIQVLPVASLHDCEMKVKVREFESVKDANAWKEFILPEKAVVYEK